ncbi:hypothetical protein OG394_22385 [Kribbella sp. NBC_01245]|uniref:hypothetical protein n=1 Tax=Kribbella sp. NBC_01245 TaxID=2903578 RepID=UPI002E2C1C31|nr:hypothetical protein [Kribbella sp. NBC_01245]
MRHGLVLVALTPGLSAATSCDPPVTAPTAPSPSAATPSATGGPKVPGPNGAGIRLLVTPRPDGSFVVTERVVLRRPVSTLPLRLPDVKQAKGAVIRPAAVDLKVSADDVAVAAAPIVVTSSTELVLGTPGTVIEFRYRLTGTTWRAEPSPPGRVLSLITPLAAGADETLPTVILVGSGLRNASCPELPEPRCAFGAQPHLTVQPDIPAGQATVILQLDLPKS